MSDTARQLQSIIDRVRPRLLALTESMAAERPAPGKWSPKEIIGHLIDSASNNHQRFIRAQFRDDLVFDGYQQDEWVRLQDYQSADWEKLVELWYYFNWQIARLIALTPEAQRVRPRTRHNLDRIAMYPIPAAQATTLDYFMRDYVQHLEGHLRQIFPDYASLTLPV